MKTILIVVFLLISSFCFAQRDSTLYKELTKAIPVIQKQINEAKEINIALINLQQKLKDYQEIILFIQQIWYQEELKLK